VEPPSEVLSLYALPERRHALLATGLDELGPHGDHAWLWVFAGSHPARAFSARLGFMPDGCERVDEGVEIRLRADL
jgi:hypothetical protein